MPTEAAYGLEIFGRFFQYPMSVENALGNAGKDNIRNVPVRIF
jgi:hypothetical protein